jgi:hypothetical protein
MILQLLAQVTPTPSATATQAGSTWLDFLRDPIWQFVGAAVAIVFGTYEAIRFFRGQHRKQVLCRIEHNSPFITLNEESALGGRLSVRFDNKPIRELNIRSIVVAVRNTGNAPIGKTLYAEPLTFSFGANCEVLTSDILNTEPVRFQANTVIEDNAVVLEPVLLNPKQAVLIRVLVRNLSDFLVRGNIEGVKIRRMITTPSEEDSLFIVLVRYSFGFLFVYAFYLLNQGVLLFPFVLIASGTVLFYVIQSIKDTQNKPKTE